MIRDLHFLQFILKSRKDLKYILSLTLIVLLSQQGKAQYLHQFSNIGTFQVQNKTILFIDMDYENFPFGNFSNDGSVYTLHNFRNDGILSYSDSKSEGQITFEGYNTQRIYGAKISDFQKVVFESKSTSLVPFLLETSIRVGDNSDFKLGIINAADSAKVIFKDDATASNASDLSFVDGKVQKTGRDEFEFPVGNDLYFRPSFHSEGNSSGDYTTQYFHQNSDSLHPHSSNNDPDIIEINTAEYWNVSKDDANSENIVLWLTLNNATTPASFFNLPSDKAIGIVRWDGTKWVNDKGIQNDPDKEKKYEDFVAGKVGGYGMFTTAIINKPITDPTDVIVYNAVSPNGDGMNDTFLIEGISKYPDNEVEIYNRWGVKVYDAKSYNESDNMFTGYSDGRATTKRGEKLPTGTYFYIIKYNNGVKGIEKSGYLYINNQ